MGEWRSITLGEVSTNISYGYTASASQEECGPKFLRITDIVPDRINWDTVPYCSIEDKKIEKYNLEFGDIVIARTGATTGYNKLITKNNNSVFASYLIRYRINFEIANPYYVAYNLQSYEWKGFVEGIIGGSAQPGANAKQFASFNLLLPPLKEQKAIAEVLSSLDDKIDLLHRQNKTLEALAQTLFREWFVEGAEDDWEVVTLEYFANNPRKSIKPSQIKKDAKYIGLEHIERKNISLMKLGKAEEVASNKYEFKENDILFGKLRPYFHKVCFTSHDGICSTDILVIRPKEEKYFPFMLFALFQEDVINYANSGSEGTRMPRTNWNMLKQYPTQIPSNALIENFNTKVLPMIEKIKQNQQQIKTLENMRDTLLPKLMSGEVRVKKYK